MGAPLIETGVLVTWKDRYGFIRPDARPDGDSDCFIPASHVPPGVVAREGLRLSYVRAIGRTGRVAAMDVSLARTDGNR